MTHPAYHHRVTTPSYTVTRKPIRTLRLRVVPPHGEVHVSAPRHVSEHEIERFVSSRVEWIAQAQARIASQPAPLQPGPETEALRRRLKADAPPLIAYWAERMGVPRPTLTVRRMTSRWGSCNPQRVHINLNLELARRDPELLEYVIVHELAHLIEASHNARFYAVMDRHLPGWKALRRQLNGR